MASPTSGLLIGVGNLLRGDDGAGHAVIEQVLPATGDQIDWLCCQQLLPEHAALLSNHAWALMVDAAVPTAATPPGTICCTAIHPDGVTLQSSAHHITPACLLGWTRLLYTRVPRFWLITITGASFAYSTTLSPAVRHAMPQTIQIISEWLRYA